MIDLVFVDVNPELCLALSRAFYGINSIRVFNAPFDNRSSFDYLMTPGNSYGWMDGGFDLVVRNQYGMKIQDDVQQAIAQKGGVFSVGEAVVVPLPGGRHLVYAPTMEMPQFIHKRNVCLATRAAFQAIVLHLAQSRKERAAVVSPGFGTLSGGVHPLDAAYEMQRAWRSVFDAAR